MISVNGGKLSTERRKNNLVQDQLCFQADSWLKKTVQEFGVYPRLSEAVAILQKKQKVTQKTTQPRPHFFLIPNVKTKPLFKNSEFDWIQDLKNAFHDIKHELEQNDAIWQQRATAYADHNTAHREKFGQTRKHWLRLPIGEYKQHFPKTWTTLSRFPLHQPENPQMSLFSIMKPKTKIPAHTGLMNDRLLCHLPVIVPKDCGLRVADHVIKVQECEPFVFDDCYEHEAWNNSNLERVVMIFSIAHPDLEQEEQKAIRFFINQYFSFLSNLTEEQRLKTLKEFSINY